MEKLTHAEEETMQAVWRTGEGNVKAFMEYLDTDIPYTTVASTMVNFFVEQKKLSAKELKEIIRLIEQGNK